MAFAVSILCQWDSHILENPLFDLKALNMTLTRYEKIL